MFFKFKDVEYLEEENPRLPERLGPFFWYFLRQLKAQFVTILVLFALSNILVSIVPYFIKILIEGFEAAADRPDELYDILAVPIMLFVGLMLIFQPAMAQAGNYIQARTLPVFSNMIRRQLSMYMHNHSYGYFQSDYAGRLAGKVVEMPMAMVDCTYTALGAIWYAVLGVAVSIWLYATIDLYFGLIAFVAMACYAMILAYFVPRLQRMTKSASEERSIVRGRCVDTLSNILTVKLFARRKHEDAYFIESLKKTADSFVKVDLKLWNLWVVLEIWTVTFWIFTFGLTLYGWQHGFVSVAEAAMILPLTLQVTNTSWWMSEIFANFFQRLGEVQEGMHAIIKAHDILDKPDAPDMKVTEAKIELDKVCFGYDGKPLFKDLSFTIKPGEKVGLVGPSGAGKSSLVQILLRLYDIQGGEIRIDDQNVASVSQDSLRDSIAVIPQMSDMLHRSIRDNILYGRLDASEEDMIAAAKKASAHEFIMELSDQYGNTGYDSVVGERGVKLSGGQRQRIAIARAILKDAPILILDEATSALDSESERAIQRSLEDLMQGRSVIAIAHRLSTIAHMDRLFVMHEGKIIEEGTHNDLIKQDGHYARLWAMQSGGFLGDDGKS